MLSDVMEHFGLSKSLHVVAYYDSEYHQHVFKDLKAAIHEGGIVAITGVVGSGKTVLLARMQQHLREEGQMEVCESLVFDVPRVTLHTLKLALYYDLATEKDGDITSKPEKSERALMRVMQRCQKPIVSSLINVATSVMWSRCAGAVSQQGETALSRASTPHYGSVTVIPATPRSSHRAANPPAIRSLASQLAPAPGASGRDR